MSERVFTNCTNAGPVSVYVKDGKVTRMRPLVADEGEIGVRAPLCSPPLRTDLMPAYTKTSWNTIPRQ